MHRQALLELLESYAPLDEREAHSCSRITSFVRDHADCFERSCGIGHITGSAWVLDSGRQRVLLTHHRKLNRWLQPGGHADGDPDVLRVALREAHEESGLTRVESIQDGIFDVDVHTIPERPGEPRHDHFDVRFLVGACGSDALHISDESNDLAWFTAPQLEGLDTDDSVRRMCRKWLALSTEDYL